MEAIESIDRECAALGGLFQQVVNDMKTGVPHYEDFISRAGKLHAQLKTTIYALGSFLDTFQKIADAATNTKGATREIGACLTRIVIRHKAMEARMKTLCSALFDCLVMPLHEKIEDWKKVANTLDKEHSKEYKKLRSELKKKTDNSTRLLKKQKKGKGDPDPKVEQSLHELGKHVRNLHEVEKAAVRRALVEERSRYCTFIACLKPVLGEEISLVSELQQLEEVMVKLDKHTEDPFKLPEASEQVLNDIKSVSGGVVFQTPPSSPSSLGSRKSSMCSISSAGSSSGGSTNSPSHQAQHLHKQPRHNQVGGGVGGLVHPMRLSSISSQDSGFTSQDTLFLRPGSPSGSGHPRGGGVGGLKTPDGSEPELGGGWSVPGMPGPPLLSDRPHTISSAYEKGHQRPALQPYTFNPPERTILEEEERPCASPRSEDSAGSSRPPVPQRFINPDRPSLPTKTQAALSARLQLSQGGGPTGLPNFNCNQPDMVVPQPVYMNMSDLSALSANHHNHQQEMMVMMGTEEGPDLKTPTAEDQSGLGSDGSGGSSSSGYGSQITMGEPTEAPQGHQQRGGGARPPFQRPYSFTSGVVPELEFSEALGVQLGQNRGSGTLLRRSMSQQGGGSRPPMPPARRCSLSQEEEEEEPGANSSNTTTPRGSMEFLPPPPPHLLHSDEEEEEAGGVSGKRAMSVAESVRELQRRQSQQQAARQSSSPATLRRVQSMSGPSGCYPNNAAAVTSTAVDRSQIRAKLDAALASSPRGVAVGPRAASPAAMMRLTPAQQEQIYAPVAALQQKIQQQQQTRLAHGHAEPGSVPHPPGPQICQQQQGYPQQQSYQQQQQQQEQQQMYGFQQNNTKQQANGNGSPEGEQYGFGMQFQIHSKSFYARQQQHIIHHAQQQQLGYHHHHQQQQQQQQHHHHHHHDQIMAEMDPMLGQRPQPPDINGHFPGGGVYVGGGGGNVHNGMGHCDIQSAMRVRQWIETRTVSDVRKVRPILNQEIQRGLSLRKTTTTSDRSQPRF